ncbi:hypothetical protein [Tenacibaculum finnmarkense]|uniref:hypothetical protein n=1 Tax=Tenacibaculum finnmarkense TaxID=2781243 RepID=UPI001E3478EC|nr:hypothetical protein [Tenacibaculum finnmarkense]MCD8412295.1 hypothetical protein [Tenacibaculum finnmarkense genomovar ulcerans]
MKHLFILFASLLICGCNQTKSTPILIEKGISKQLATYRKQQVDAVKYALTFNIPEAKSDVIPSTLKVSATIKDLSNDLILDFNEKKSNIKSIIVNNSSFALKYIYATSW